MTELSLHILDIANNSLAAGAAHVAIELTESCDWLTLVITDDGCGMDEQLLAAVMDPFTTTRTTRRVGMGLPLFRHLSEQTGGKMTVESKAGCGTTVTATFALRHIDRPPLGDMAATMVTLIQGRPDVDFIYSHRRADNACVLNTADMRVALEDVPLNSPNVLAWVRGYISEHDL